MNLNPGGFLGAAVGAGAGVAIMMAAGGYEENPGRVRLIVVGLVAGAIAGNTLWAAVFGKPKPKPEEEDDARPRRRRPRDDEEDDDRPCRTRRDEDDNRA